MLLVTINCFIIHTVSLPLAATSSFIYNQTWPKPFHSTSDNYITFFQGLFCHHCLLGPSQCRHSCRLPSRFYVSTSHSCPPNSHCSKRYKWKVKVKSLSCAQLFATPWTVAYQAPPSTGFSRQECLSGLPFPSPGHLPDQGIECFAFWTSREAPVQMEEFLFFFFFF